MSTTSARPPVTLRHGVERRPARPRRQHVAAPLTAEATALLSALGVDIRARWETLTSTHDLVLTIEQRAARISITMTDRDETGYWLAGVGPCDDAVLCLRKPRQGATVVVGVDGVWRCVELREPPPVECDA